MSIKNAAQFRRLHRAGRLVARTLDTLQAAVAPGVSTRELDDVAADVFDRAGARSGPILTYRFPGAICVSVGSEIVHGVPGPRILGEGELVSLDVAAELDGYYADSARTIPVGAASAPALALVAATREALACGIRAARPGATVRQVGGAVQAAANARGFKVVRELTGHGIGKKMHEAPTIYNWPSPQGSARLTAGLVMTVEPMLVAGRPELAVRSDGWTVETVDGSLAAHEEHTIVVTDRGPVILTLA
jgi:methionyl aminopeptidase